jgi:hypothetical protein
VLGCEALRSYGYRGVEVRLTHARALEATGDHGEARIRLASARAQILATAARIEDPEIRRSFLRDVPENARTLALAGG